MRRVIEGMTAARYKDDPDTMAWLSGLGPSAQRFADALEAELISC